MVTKLSGQISFANGLAAPDVEVRVFDQDAPGKGDDDLTVFPGKTDAQGRFTLRYDPGRYLDFARLPVLGLRVPDVLDILAPYLRMTYTFDGQERVFTTPLVPFQSHYHLPETAPLHFLPSRNGFAFENNFPPITLPITIPGFPKLRRITGGYGLCGGMSAAASDYFLCGRTLPQSASASAGAEKSGAVFAAAAPAAAAPAAPPVRSQLYRYLFRRAMDSFRMGESVLRFAQWMALGEDGPNGTQSLTKMEVEKLRAALDAQRLVPLGLVIAQGRTFKEISHEVWTNHQVLAYGYTQNGDGSLDVRVYDPNTPGRDDVYIHITPTADGVQCQPVNLRVYPPRIRGLFLMPYDPVEPPGRLA